MERNQLIPQQSMLLRKVRYLVVFAGLAMLLSCKTSLAPEYDQVIVDQCAEATARTMTLFAEVSDGVEKATFQARESRYNELIGIFDALALQARSRPVPSNEITEKINALLSEKGTTTVTGRYPSAVAFEQVARTLQKMRDTDKANGIHPQVTEAFKGQIMIFLDQAITYERFLKR